MNRLQERRRRKLAQQRSRTFVLLAVAALGALFAGYTWLGDLFRSELELACRARYDSELSRDDRGKRNDTCSCLAGVASDELTDEQRQITMLYYRGEVDAFDEMTAGWGREEALQWVRFFERADNACNTPA